MGRPKAAVTGSAQERRRVVLAFFAVTTLFFAWGFITSNNDPLIVTLRAAFSRPRVADESNMGESATRTC